jgi:hypothetical protein
MQTAFFVALFFTVRNIHKSALLVNLAQLIALVWGLTRVSL